MQLEDYFDFLAPNDIRLKGHRIGIETILTAYFDQHMSVEEIVYHYPSLTPEKVHATLTYYWHNKEKIDAYLQALEEHTAQMIREAKAGSPMLKLLDLEELRRRMREKQSREIV